MKKEKKQFVEWNQGYSFDDVLLEPCYSEVLPSEVSLETRLTNSIFLKIPFVSAAMDTVTEEKMAITMALQGGIGIIHKNCSPEKQAKMVEVVKRYENGFIFSPKVLSPEDTIQTAINIRKECGFKSIPITKDGTLNSEVVGILTRNDYLGTKHANCLIKERMTMFKDLFVKYAPITLAEANDALEESKHSKLLILNQDRTIYALLSRTDLEKNEQYPNATKDENKRLRVGAAVGPGQGRNKRIELLISAGTDILVVDTAHGHTKGVGDCVRYIKKNFPKVQVIAGNVATSEGAQFLINCGADGIKVGIGPGSICTTRIVTGVGVPQLTALLNLSEICNKYNIPFIADGGIRYSGDIAKALATGASSVMIGSLFAGTDESPGEIIFSEGKRYKLYRGMGSLSAMKIGSKDRYLQSNVANEKLVAEGIEAKVLYKGSVVTEIEQLLGGLKNACGYLGAKNIFEIYKKAKFIIQTEAGRNESHPHGVPIFQEAPNYRGRI